MRTERLHVAMIVAYTLVLALILYTIRAIDYPFEEALSRMGSHAGR